MRYLHPILLAAAAALAACSPQDEPAADASAESAAPVALVNGEPITSDFFEFYIQGVTGRSSSDLTPEQREQALDNLVRAELIAQQAEKDGLTKDSETAAILHISRLNVLQQAASERYLEGKEPTEEELRAEYDTQVAQLPKLEYHARHILVESEAGAREVIAQLKKGADFGKLAAEKSIDSSKDNGGDLGWFTPDRMVKPFADSVVALEKGAVTQEPVQTQFGWHVIRLDETRALEPPPFESVRDRLQQVVQAKKFRAYTDELLKTATVDKRI